MVNFQEFQKWDFEILGILKEREGDNLGDSENGEFPNSKRREGFNLEVMVNFQEFQKWDFEILGILKEREGDNLGDSENGEFQKWK